MLDGRRATAPGRPDAVQHASLAAGFLRALRPDKNFPQGASLAGVAAFGKHEREEKLRFTVADMNAKARSLRLQAGQARSLADCADCEDSAALRAYACRLEREALEIELKAARCAVAGRLRFSTIH